MPDATEADRRTAADGIIETICEKTDYDLLYAQKQELIHHMHTGEPIPKQALEGLVNFLDQIGDLGETLGRFQYDGIEPPFPLRNDYEKKTYSFEPEPAPKVYMLCEEYENQDNVRSFTILATSRDEDALKQLLQAKVEKDEYGFIAKNGIYESRDTYFASEFCDGGFVEYYILGETVLNREKTVDLLKHKDYDPEFSYPKGFRDVFVKQVCQIAAEEGYGEIKAEKVVDAVMKDKLFQAELRDTYWFTPTVLHSSDQDRCGRFCTNRIYDMLDKDATLFERLGAVPTLNAPDNLRVVLEDAAFDVARDLRLKSVNIDELVDTCLKNVEFRTLISNKLGYIPHIEQSSLAYEEAFGTCYSFLTSKIWAEISSGKQNELPKPSLNNVISSAAQRTFISSHNQSTPTSEKCTEPDRSDLFR